jgi:NADH:ubiquinone oxidoreductase subunit H
MEHAKESLLMDLAIWLILIATLVYIAMEVQETAPHPFQQKERAKALVSVILELCAITAPSPTRR